MTDFEEFVNCGVNDIKEMKRKQGNATKSLKNLKVTMIYNTILYYYFLRSHDIGLAEDPQQWSTKDYKLWRDRGRHPTLAAEKAAAANTTSTSTPTTAPTATACPNTKNAENAWLSWQRTRRDADKYQILTNDINYNDWKISTVRQFAEDRCSRMIDDSFLPNMVKYGPNDTLLYEAQKNHMSIVLE